MWLFKDVVILMNFFEPRIIKYLSNTLIWRKSLVESCWKGAHSFNSVIEVFALAIATGFRAFALVKVFAIAILIGHATLSFFLPIRSTLAFWQPWLQTGYLLNTFLLFLVVWNIWSFGEKEAEYLFRLFAYWEGSILSKFICLTWVVSWITFNSILNTKYWEPNKMTSLILWFNCCSQEFQWFESSHD